MKKLGTPMGAGPGRASVKEGSAGVGTPSGAWNARWAAREDPRVTASDLPSTTDSPFVVAPFLAWSVVEGCCGVCC